MYRYIATNIYVWLFSNGSIIAEGLYKQLMWYMRCMYMLD